MAGRVLDAELPAVNKSGKKLSCRLSAYLHGSLASRI